MKLSINLLQPPKPRLWYGYQLLLSRFAVRNFFQAKQKVVRNLLFGEDRVLSSFKVLDKAIVIATEMHFVLRQQKRFLKGKTLPIGGSKM